MTRKKHRLLSLVLVFVMALSMMPMRAFATVATEQTDTTAEQRNSTGVDVTDLGTEFTTFEELAAIAKSSNTEERTLMYTGKKTSFVVSGDLELPDYISVNFSPNRNVETTLEIGEGAAFEINNWIQCAGLIVNGTMTANGYINAGALLDVNGKLILKDDSISLDFPAEINGLENISFGKDWLQVTMEAPFSTAEELAELAARIANDSYVREERVGYNLYYEGESDDIVIDCDVEIPECARLEFYTYSNSDTTRKFSIAANCTLENYGEMNILTPLTVNGELVNDGVLDISNRDRFKGTLTLGEGGVYSGNGEFGVHTTSNVSDLSKILPGFDLENMIFKTNVFGSEKHWNLDTSGTAFTTFEKLVSMLESEDFSGECVEYVGSTPLIIEEDLEIPAGIHLEMRHQDLEVAEDVEFVLNESLNCGELVVKGSMTASEWLYAEDGVTVSGVLTAARGLNAGSALEVTEEGSLIVADNSVFLDYSAALTGLDRISFANEWQKVIFQAEAEDTDELAELAAKLVTDYLKNDRVGYSLSMQWVNHEESTVSTTISESIEVPAHVELQLNGNREYTIADGVTITVDGMIYIAAPVELNGTLVNNTNVNISYQPNNQRSDDNGTITLGANGSYSGDGNMHINVDSSVSELASVLRGFVLSDFDIEREEIWDDGSRQWVVKHAGGLIKLGTPIELKWGTEYREIWVENPTTGKMQVQLEEIEKPGFISWATVLPDQAEAQIYIYREGENRPCASERYGFGEEVEPEYRSADTFLINDLESGSYYFTVQSIADYREYRNSDVAVSGVYKYEKPDEKLETCTNLKWEDRDDRFVRWVNWDDNNSDQTYVDGYEVEISYSATENGIYEQFGGMRGRGNEESESPLGTHFFQQKGIGYYKFRVRTLSGNIEETCNSQWSPWSAPLNMEEIPDEVNDSLDDIISDTNNTSSNMTATDIRDAVQNIDTQDLQAALATDQDNTGATEKLAELEQKAGGAAEVVVTREAAAFKESEVSIVGANLNNKEAEADPVQLIVDKPKKDHVIPELYNSAVAVKFSMTLDNVENPEELKVPVKITLPIPNSINPEFAVIFHYHADGSHEIVEPYVYRKNGKWYADFVLTSFSDFILTEVLQDENEGGTGNGGNDSDNRRDDDDDDDRPTAVQSQKPTINKPPISLPEYVVAGSWTAVNGKWSFTDNTGKIFRSRWAAVYNPYANIPAGQSAFDWFYFDENDQMVTGWLFDGGLWYYLNPESDGTQGRMLTGWQLIDGKWYYFNPVSDGTKGAMLADTWVDSYYVDASGAWDNTKTKYR